MYKTKLQELCHKRRWSLPKYSSMKDGPDHNPRFKSSVSVNGLSFHSSVSCKSYKDSQNDVAMLAFLHFTTPTAPPQPASSLISSAEPADGELETGETAQDPGIYAVASGHKNDLQHLYKIQLQSYARHKNLEFPQYSSVREGLDHAPRFKATVTVDGRTFQSPEFFTNSKQAEHAAAKVAIMSLSLNGFQEDDSGFYKNLLQQFCQREDLSMPVYKTIKSGASHMPTFSSTVEVEGDVFYGKAGKSKKEAEMKAAKVACIVLMECGNNESIGFSSSTIEVDGTSKSTSISDLVVKVDSQKLKQKCDLSSSSGTNYADDNEGDIKPITEEVQELHSTETVAPNAQLTSTDSTSSPAPNSPQGCSFSSSMMEHPDVSSLSISDSSVGTASGTSSYLLCNRVRVYPSIPNITFPKGIIVLPISNNRWVVVSLEFPNESN